MGLLQSNQRVLYTVDMCYFPRKFVENPISAKYNSNCDLNSKRLLFEHSVKYF